MNWMEIISLLLNLVLGTGFIVSIYTLKSAKVEADANAKRAVAEARSIEIKNAEGAIIIYHKLANEMSEKYNQVAIELEGLRKEINKLNRINTRIMKLLDKITHDNMDLIISQIKEEIKNEKNDGHHPFGGVSSGDVV